MEKLNKLSEEQIEALTRYLYCFKSAYIIATGKNLETVNQIIEVINDGVFTFEDVFLVNLDDKFRYADYQVSCTWDDHMEKFDYQNFFPEDRGISENTARLMASLNQTYFKVNMNMVLDKYSEQFSRVKLISA